MIGAAWAAGRADPRTAGNGRGARSGRPPCWRPSGTTARGWRSPANARGSRETCTRSWRAASRRWSFRPKRHARQLDHEPAAADAALEAVEDVGRQALSEMRRILGVLRQRDHAGELLEPQPGVDQIYRLIERAREHGQHVELTIEGQPGPLSAGVDLGIYRILEDALASIRPDPATAVAHRPALRTRRTWSCSSPRRAEARATGRPTRCASACCCAAGS